MKQLINLFLNKLSNHTDENFLTFLKKQKTTQPIFFMKDGKVEKLSPDEFYKIFEVNYLPTLFFESKKILKKVARRSLRQIKKGFIAEKEIWLGTYLENNFHPDFAAPVYIKWIDEKKGFGLFAISDIKKGTYIGEYTGVVKKYSQLNHSKNSYCFEYQIGAHKRFHLTIDAKHSGNHVRFINHSFIPNLDTFAAYSQKVMHIVLKTNSFVKKDSELTYDYGPKYWKKREKPV